jgi:alcohol dehydrogenase (cytochrome c)
LRFSIIEPAAKENDMKKLFGTMAILAAMHAPACAQSQQDLARDGKGGRTDNVLTYGMGYNQNRYSTLRQINKSNVKRLVPVWSTSLSSNYGEQGQPLVYNGVMFVANAEYTIAIDVATGKQLWRTAVDFDPSVPRVVC